MNDGPPRSWPLGQAGTLDERIDESDRSNPPDALVVVGSNVDQPKRSGDAGYDLRAEQWGTLDPLRSKLVETGVSVAVPEGHVGLVCSRSGLAAEHGVHVLNAPGVVDSGYRGSVKVLLHNLSGKPFHWDAGDRIAQLLLVPVITPPVTRVPSFEDDTERGNQGFGSTGTH